MGTGRFAVTIQSEGLMHAGQRSTPKVPGWSELPDKQDQSGVALDPC